MLSTTRKSSPIRIAAGLVGVSALSLAALGLTASGTQAAEKLKNKVESVTGVTLVQDVPAPPAPPAPPSSAALAALPAPPVAPVAPVAPDAEGRHVEKHVYRFAEDGEKDGKRVKKIVIVRADGTTEERQMPDIDSIRASVPDIREGKCGNGSAPTIESSEGGKKRIVICTDRIERLSADSVELAVHSKRMGLESARMGLRMARRSIEGDTSMSAASRAEALKGIDEALAEIDREAKDKD